MTSSKNDTIELSEDEALKLLRGTGKPLCFVDIAILIASSAHDVAELLRLAKGESKPKQPLPPPPPLPVWLSMYRKHREVADCIFASLEIVPEHSASEILDDSRLIQSLSYEDRYEIAESMSREEQEILLRLFMGVPFPPNDEILRAALEVIDSDAESDPHQVDDAFKTPQGQYYFRVWLPCWMMYREYPPRLLRQARLGDSKSLDKLLRLDKSIVHDPKIADHVHRLTHSGSKRDRDFILQAIEGCPKVKLDAKTIKYGLSGMISQFAILFRCKVTAPEITQLFDGIERVRTGRLCDPHIPAGESFTKGVSRNRNWTTLPRK